MLSAGEIADPAAEREAIRHCQDHATDCNSGPLGKSVGQSSWSVAVLSPVLHAHLALPCFTSVRCSGLALPEAPGVPEWNVKVIKRPDTQVLVHLRCQKHGFRLRG